MRARKGKTEQQSRAFDSPFDPHHKLRIVSDGEGKSQIQVIKSGFFFPHRDAEPSLPIRGAQ